MAGDARKDARHVEIEKNCDTSGIYLVADRTSRGASLPGEDATTEKRTISQLGGIGAKTLLEKPTDELSVLLSKKTDGSVSRDEQRLIPKNPPLPDPELYKLAESLQSCYERSAEGWNNKITDDTRLALSQMSGTWSRQPPSTRTYPWKRVASFVTVALVGALLGAGGGWYGAWKVSRIITAESAPVESADESESNRSQPSPKKLDTITPSPIRQTLKPRVGAVPTESAGVSPATESTQLVDKKEEPHSKMVRALDSVGVNKSVSRAPKPKRPAVEAISPEVSKEAVETAISRRESSKFEPAIARSDGSKDSVFKPIAAEIPTPPRMIKATEKTGVDETIAAGNAVVSPSIPEVLTREQVRAGFVSIYQQISECAAGKHGVAFIRATLTGSGRVVFALVEGDFKGSPEGSCMARVARKATFPEFEKSKLTVEFPYVL